MDEKTIAALAREYAEEKGNVMEQKQSLPNCLIKEVVEMDATELTCFLQWLSRRYCLVEKSAVREEWVGLENQGEISMEMKLMSGVLAVGGQMSILQRLFPDVAKEVEE